MHAVVKKIKELVRKVLPDNKKHNLIYLPSKTTFFQRGIEESKKGV